MVGEPRRWHVFGLTAVLHNTPTAWQYGSGRKSATGKRKSQTFSVEEAGYKKTIHVSIIRRRREVSGNFCYSMPSLFKGWAFVFPGAFLGREIRADFCQRSGYDPFYCVLQKKTCPTLSPSNFAPNTWAHFPKGQRRDGPHIGIDLFSEGCIDFTRCGTSSTNSIRKTSTHFHKAYRRDGLYIWGFIFYTRAVPTL